MAADKDVVCALVASLGIMTGGCPASLAVLDLLQAVVTARDLAQPGCPAGALSVVITR